MNYEINPDYSQVKPLIENIEKYFQESADILHKARNEIRVVSYNGTSYVIKAFKIPNLVNRIAYRYLRPSKAKRSYWYSLKLGADLSPAAVAYIEEYENTLLSKSYYVSNHFDYDFEIRALLKDKTFNNRTQILKEFAEFTYKLHERGVLHRDYSPGNILIKKQDRHFQFKVVDVNRMEFKTLNLNARLSNFVRLEVDDETLKIIIFKYAELIQLSPKDTLATARQCSDTYQKKRALKNKLRGR